MIFLWLFLSMVARAQEVPWYLGLPIAQVSLESAEGGLPNENLEPLLRIHQGDRLDPRDLRKDLELLFRVGLFASVEASVEPWLILDERGQPLEAVRVVYRVAPPPRLVRVDIEGVRGEARHIVEDSLGLSLGDAFYPREELEPLRSRILRALAGEGWNEAEVIVESEDLDTREIGVIVRVAAGSPRTYGQLKIGGELGVSERRVRRWLRSHGIREGERLVTRELSAAREDIQDQLVRRGWLLARVRFVFFRGEDGETLSVLVESGGRVLVERVGRGLPGRKELRGILGLNAGVRVSEGVIEEAKRSLVAWYRERGYLEALVGIDRESSEGVERLRVKVSPGELHVLRRIVVQGADSYSQRFIAGAIREAEPDTLGQGVVTAAAVTRALEEVQDFYRGQGFLEAQLGLLGMERSSRGFGGIPVDLEVEVMEGTRAWLSDLSQEGGVGLEDEHLSRSIADLVGEPFRQAGLDALSREVVEIYRDHGYLKADARVRAEVSEDGAEATAMLLIDPGPQVRLRSIVIQGNQRTRRRVIEREIEVKVGEPVSASGIEETREQLYSLDLFRVVSPQLVGDDDRSRDLILMLEERPNLRLEVGGGAATDAGVRLTSQLTHRNLFAMGHRVSALGQVGYEYASEGWALDLTEPVWRAAVRYEAPHLPWPEQRLVVDGLLNEVVQEPTFRLLRSGIGIGVDLIGSDVSGLFVDYHFQRRHLEDIDAGALVVGDPWLETVGLGEDDLFGEPVLPSDYRYQGELGVLWLRDRRDDRFNPTRGFYASGHLAIGDGVLVHQALIRSTLRLEKLVGVGPAVLALQGKGGAGWVEGKGATLPIEERFVLGGTNSLRGFRLDEVGPAREVSRTDIDFPDSIEPLIDGLVLAETATHWVPTGGDAMTSLTVEFRVPMPVLGFRSLDSTSLVVFSDSGWVGFLDPVTVEASRVVPMDYRASMGMGVRVKTPIGPVSLDLGVNPSPLEDRDEPLARTHLSLGAL
ncbi:MAG: POTRA domain-containing protein [Myxococcota bacterium]|nr:POTRA domain-containing protein [Myxococcota bacterium]